MKESQLVHIGILYYGFNQMKGKPKQLISAIEFCISTVYLGDQHIYTFAHYVIHWFNWNNHKPYTLVL